MASRKPSSNLNKIPNVSKRFKPRENHFFNYHCAIDDAFKKDCEKLLLMFQARKNFSFKTFTEVWQELNFSLIFVGQQFVQELYVFPATSFFTIKKYITFSNDLYIQVGAFYLLYGMYMKQPLKEGKVQIPLTCSEYKDILNLVQKMKEQNVLEFVCIFVELECLQAFHLVKEPWSFGLEPKFAWQGKNAINDIFQSTDTMTPVERIEKLFKDPIYGLESLKETCKEYDEALKEFFAENPDKEKIVPQGSHLVEDLQAMLNELREVEHPSHSTEDETVQPPN